MRFSLKIYINMLKYVTVINMILKKDIITDDNPLLRQKSVDVSLPLSIEDEALLDEMME